MRIVVTGASGNVGTALLRRLTQPGLGHEVVGVVRRVPDLGLPYEEVTWVAADVADPSVGPSLLDAMAGADAVVHLAWGFQPSRDVDYLERVGVGGTRAVLQAATASDVPHVVHMSSLGAYSPKVSNVRVDESYPTGGVPSLPYSRHKAAVETMLDSYAADRSGPAIARLRPGLIVQAAAGSALLRYGVPAYVPAALLRHVLVLPVDRSLVIQLVHSDDVADAIVRVLDQRATGPFNLAAEKPIDRADIADALSAHPVHVPEAVLRAIVSATWRAHLQALDPGWIDLAFQVPLMRTDRARDELGWTPTVSAFDALEEVVAAMSERRSGDSPPLRPRAACDLVDKALRRGPIGNRRLP